MQVAANRWDLWVKSVNKKEPLKELILALTGQGITLHIVVVG